MKIESLKDIINETSAADIMVQALTDAGFEGDLSEGSPIHQLLIDPAALLYANNILRQNELAASWSLLSVGLDDEESYDLEVARNVFNNLLISPTPGSLSTGRVQITFSDNASRSLALSSFISPDGTTFVADGAYSAVQSEAHRSTYSDKEIIYTKVNDGYAVDIGVESTAVGTTVVSSGTVMTTSVPGIISVVASTSFTAGKQKSDVLDLVAEIPTVLTETSMTSPISITAALSKAFPETNEIRIFRAGDDEVLRANNNLLGTDSGVGDIYVASTPRPNIERLFISGYLELSCNTDGIIFNSEHNKGYAYRSESDDDDAITATGILSGVAYVEGTVVGDEHAGSLYVLDACLVTDSTDIVSSRSSSSRVSSDVDILGRGIIKDDRYGALTVSGDKEEDFYFSSFQDRLKFEFATKYAVLDTLSPELYSKITAWVSFWNYYYKGVVEEEAYEADLIDFASEFGTTPDKMPRIFRTEFPSFVDVVGYSNLDAIQHFVNERDRRCFGQDYVIKAPFVNNIGLSITVSRTCDFIRFKEEHFKDKITQFINTKGLYHSSPITTEHIKSLIFEEGPSNSNTTFALSAINRTINSSNEWVTSASSFIDYLLPEPGRTPNNTILNSDSDQVVFTYI